MNRLLQIASAGALLLGTMGVSRVAAQDPIVTGPIIASEVAPIIVSAVKPKPKPTGLAKFVGTVMVANVFLIIIPNQRKVVADLIAGRTPDPALGAAAKQRSLHNNYMTLPVLFIMISHHYPMTYGAERPWLDQGRPNSAVPCHI